MARLMIVALLCTGLLGLDAASVFPRPPGPSLGQTSQENIFKQTQQTVHERPTYLQDRLGIMDTVDIFLRDQRPQIQGLMVKLLGKLDNAGVRREKTQSHCIHPITQCPPAGGSTDLVAKYRKILQSVQDDTPGCNICQRLVELLQDAACSTDWVPMRDGIIDTCEALFPPLQLDPVMCNGTVTLQGEHLYCIAQQVTALEFCESMDACLPPAISNKLPMSERAPWVVKDKVQEEYRKILASNPPQPKEKQDILTVLQMSDIHLQAMHAWGTPADCQSAACCLKDSVAFAGTPYARGWGEYRCNLPEKTMRVFLREMAALEPDMVLYAGDNPPHTIWDETLQSQVNCSEIVANALKQEFANGTKMYSAIGNHEMYPTNLYSMWMPETGVMNQEFNRIWKDLAQLNPAAEQTWTNMSMYTMLYETGLRILVINTNYDWYNANFYISLNYKDPMNQEHKTFVETTLANARIDGEKVIIVGHHPVGTAIVRANRWWEQVALEYGDIIILHVSGHTHSDHFYLNIDDATSTAATVNLVSSVMSPRTNNNPSARVFQLDRADNFRVLTYTSYFFKIDEQLPDVDPVVERNYDAAEEYNMADMSAVAWQELSLRFLDDDPLFQTYYRHRHGDANLGCPGDSHCSESCKNNQICNMWFPSSEDSDQCNLFWKSMKQQQDEAMNQDG